LIRQILVLLFLILFSIELSSCKSANKVDVHQKLRTIYCSSEFKGNNPVNYIDFKKGYIYLFKNFFSVFNPSVIEIPINYGQKRTLNNSDLKYYYFDIDIWNSNLGYDSLSNHIRNIKTYIFNLDVPLTPDFSTLHKFNSENRNPCKSIDTLSFIILNGDDNELYTLYNRTDASEYETNVLKWLKFLKKISFLDAMYYDRILGEENSSFMEYAESNEYIIPSSEWKKR
jgi:hypothetical protein